MGIKEMLFSRLEQQERNDLNIKSKDIQTDIKTCKVEIRVTEEEKEMLRAMAKLNRTTQSELIRQVIFNKYINELIKNI